MYSSPGNTDDPDFYGRRSDIETSRGYGDTDSPDKLSEAAYWFLVDNDRPEGWTWHEVSQRVNLGQCPWHRFSDLARKGLILRLYGDDGKLIKRPGASSRPQAVWRRVGRDTFAGDVAKLPSRG